jgi:hypothetical protein
VEYSGASNPSSIETGRKSLTVVSSSALNEVVLPIVVNGSFAENLHYQTIFNILNSSAQQIETTLQVYGNQGKPGGVFCAPIAPPPSSAAATLAPNAEYLQFTSADLLFHGGWALLRWEGSPSVLAAEEITLVAAAPQACMLVCNWPSTEKLSSTQIPAIKPAREFRLPVTINRYRRRLSHWSTRPPPKRPACGYPSWMPREKRHNWEFRTSLKSGSVRWSG